MYLKLLAPQTYPARTVAIPCDRCGEQQATASIGLINGHVRLCSPCLHAALALFEGFKEPKDGA